ncbi:hypothetical protein JCM16408A_26700 [Methylobacterium phyllosphaerae]
MVGAPFTHEPEHGQTEGTPMRMKIIGLAAALTVVLTGAAYAQQPAGGGSATGNMNNPGSVKSEGQKATEEATGTSTRSPAAGAAAVPGTGTARPGVGAGGSTAAPAR